MHPIVYFGVLNHFFIISLSLTAKKGRKETLGAELRSLIKSIAQPKPSKLLSSFVKQYSAWCCFANIDCSLRYAPNNIVKLVNSVPRMYGIYRNSERKSAGFACNSHSNRTHEVRFGYQFNCVLFLSACLSALNVSTLFAYANKLRTLPTSRFLLLFSFSFCFANKRKKKIEVNKKNKY